MYDGFMAYDGVPLLDATRTKAMAEAAGAGWYAGCDPCPGLGLPTDVTTAPWWDPNFYDVSRRFFGLVATSISPFLSSRAIRPVTPLARSGASIGRRYEQHREVVVAASLLALDRPAAVYGMEWLTNFLQYGALCGEHERDRTGFDLEVWLWCPRERVGAHQRFLYEVHVTDGPTILRERDLSGGCGHIIDVEFTLTAANPGVYGETIGFGQIAGGQLKDRYTDVQHTGLDGNVLPQPRTYDQLRNLVQPYPETSYDEVMAALISASIKGHVSSETPPWEAP